MFEIQLDYQAQNGSQGSRGISIILLCQSACDEVEARSQVAKVLINYNLGDMLSTT